MTPLIDVYIPIERFQLLLELLASLLKSLVGLAKRLIRMQTKVIFQTFGPLVGINVFQAECRLTFHVLLEQG